MAGGRMTRVEELLDYGSSAEQADVVAAYLDGEGWTTYAEIVRRLGAQAIEAQRAETAQTGSVEDESAVGNADVPKGCGPKEVA